MNECWEERILITCSGISNTGKCTAQVAIMLQQRNPGFIDYFIDAAAEEPIKIPEGLDVGSACVIIIDGCGDFCAKRKAEICDILPDCHIVATDCGVVKSGMDEPKFSDIEAVCRAVEQEMRR